MRRLTNTLSGWLAALLTLNNLSTFAAIGLIHRYGDPGQLTRQLLAAEGLLLGVNLLIALVAVRRLLISPMQSVQQALRRIAAGDRSAPLDLGSPAQEIAALGRSVDALAAQLAAEREAGRRQLAELHAAEEELRAERDLLNAVFDSSVAAITVLNPAGEIVLANRSVETVLGLTHDRVTGRGYNAPEWRHTDLDGGPWPDERQPFRIVMSTGDPVFDVQHAIEWPDGSRKLLSVNGVPIKDAAGRVTSAIFTVSDITARLLAERALRESEQRLRSLIHDVSVGITLHAADGRLLLANPAACAIFQVSEEAMVGLEIGDAAWVALREDGSRFEDELTPLELAIQSRRPALDQVVGVVPPGGRLTWLLVSAAPQLDAQGAVSYIVCSYSDITERRRLEEQLRQSQKLEAVGRLAGGVAHDFNNLLTVITGSCDLILCEAERLGPELRQDVEQIRQASRRASELTRQLLAFSRRQILQPQVISLSGVVRGIEAMLRRLLGEDVRLATALADDLWPVLADSGQLEQVVMNLALNARDAMPQGGELRIATANLTLAEPEHGLPPGDYVRLTVSDSGAGIAPEHQPHIFEPFFTTKPPGRGTGLGLATVHGIVSQSGGAIDFTSLPGQGTDFAVYLPRSATPGRAPEPEAAAPQGAGGRETVLLVEDEALVRSLVRRVLVGRGYTVIEAADGVQARELVGRHRGPIDLLLTDVVMPGGLTGFELARQLRAERPITRVIFMSGYADLHLLGADQAAAADILAKPFTPDALARRVREALGG